MTAAFGIMLGLAGLIMLIAAIAQEAQNRSYAASSEAVTGTVISKRRRKAKSVTSFELTVTYAVDGIAYKKVVGVPGAEYSGISVGEEIGLLYKPDNPKRVVLPSQIHPKNARIVLIIGAVLLAAGAVMFFAGQR